MNSIPRTTPPALHDCFRIIVTWFLALLVCSSPAVAQQSAAEYAPGYSVGDRLDVMYQGTWYPASLLAIQPSGGALSGIKVKFDPPGPFPPIYETWTGPGLIRHAKASSAKSGAGAEKGGSASSASAPRPGKYNIYTYGVAGRPPIYLGYFILGDGTYKAHLPGDKLQGAGTYAYDASTHKVTWKSGPYAGEWGGDFTVEGGRRHQIRLKSNTIASNNGD
jgi:hypothetical protein